MQILDDRIMLLPTFSPFYVLNAKAQRPTLVHDLVRARRLSEGIVLENPAQSIVYVDTKQTSHWSIDHLVPPVAFDVETDEFDRLRLAGFGTAPSAIYVVPKKHIATCYLDWHWIGHNVKIDRLWMTRAGAWIEGRFDDTMLMAHLLNENRRVGLKKLALELIDPALYWKFIEPRLANPKKRAAIPEQELAEYCAHDVAATLLLYDVLKPQLEAEPRLKAIYEHMSLPLSDVLYDMELRGTPFDSGKAQDMLVDFAMEQADLEGEMLQAFGESPNWNSDDQLARLLYATLGLRPPHLTKKTGQGSTDEKALMALRDLHPGIPLLMKWKKGGKREGMVKSWLKKVEASPDGRLHPNVKITATVTGRVAYERPNLQQVPTDEVMRALFVPFDGEEEILAADYKTIELGVGAWIFDEQTMLEAYRRGDDLHALTAYRILGRPHTDKLERKKYGKTPNFGLLYQQGDDGFRDYAAKQGVDMTLDEARLMRATWHNLYPGVRAGWRRIGNSMTATGGTVVAPSGRQRRLPEFLSGSRALVNEAWRQGCNFPVQCTAAELTHVAAILSERLESLDAKLILHVHDSLVFSVPKQHTLTAARSLQYIMTQEVPAYFERNFGTPIPIPLFVEISAGPSWGETKELNLA